VTVSSAAVFALQNAAAAGIQGAGLDEPVDGGTFAVVASAPAVISALTGGSSVATSVAQMVASGTLASHARLSQARYFAPGGVPTWE
jgi:hypothetical protein